jgi:hypothetical protein
LDTIDIGFAAKCMMLLLLAQAVMLIATGDASARPGDPIR